MRYLHTMIRILDLDQSLHFYCNILGFREIRRYENKKNRFTNIFLAARNDFDHAKTYQSPVIELTFN